MPRRPRAGRAGNVPPPPDQALSDVLTRLYNSGYYTDEAKRFMMNNVDYEFMTPDDEYYNFGGYARAYDENGLTVGGLIRMKNGNDNPDGSSRDNYSFDYDQIMKHELGHLLEPPYVWLANDGYYYQDDISRALMLDRLDRRDLTDVWAWSRDLYNMPGLWGDPYEVALNTEEENTKAWGDVGELYADLAINPNGIPDDIYWMFPFYKQYPITDTHGIASGGSLPQQPPVTEADVNRNTVRPSSGIQPESYRSHLGPRRNWDDNGYYSSYGEYMKRLREGNPYGFYEYEDGSRDTLYNYSWGYPDDIDIMDSYVKHFPDTVNPDIYPAGYGTNIGPMWTGMPYGVQQEARESEGGFPISNYLPLPMNYPNPGSPAMLSNSQQYVIPEAPKPMQNPLPSVPPVGMTRRKGVIDANGNRYWEFPLIRAYDPIVQRGRIGGVIQ